MIEEICLAIRRWDNWSPAGEKPAVVCISPQAILDLDREANLLISKPRSPGDEERVHTILGVPVRACANANPWYVAGKRIL